MEKFFLSVYDAFDAAKPAFTALGMKPILHIDKYRGQPVDPTQFEYFDLPALFIDWNMKWESAGKKYMGTVNLEFHLLTDATWSTANVSTNRDAGLKSVLYLSLVRNVLDRVRSDNTGPLTRAEDTPIETEVTNYHLLKYTAPYYDPVSTNPDYIYILIEQLKLSGYLKDTL
jgi:hypothetical protein